ncbi:MAG TPA: hypothetical protein VKY74_07510 [Chloroflexia bacterium]|nr:hypothetical protein [Chloroflexia bacterium]
MSNEADTCRQDVLPARYAGGWTDAQIGDEIPDQESGPQDVDPNYMVRCKTN